MEAGFPGTVGLAVPAGRTRVEDLALQDAGAGADELVIPGSGAVTITISPVAVQPSQSCMSKVRQDVRPAACFPAQCLAGPLTQH